MNPQHEAQELRDALDAARQKIATAEQLISLVIGRDVNDFMIDCEAAMTRWMATAETIRGIDKIMKSVGDRIDEAIVGEPALELIPTRRCPTCHRSCDALAKPRLGTMYWCRCGNMFN